MDGPSISVLIPVFNGEQYLREAINSALSQTYAPQEIIVVDDGSTDGSRAIAESYGGSVVCISQVNQGPSAARNRCIEASSGEWLAFLDADDYWAPEKLEKQVAAIQRNPAAGLIYTGRIEVDEAGRSTAIWARDPEWVRARLSFQNPIYPSSLMLRRSVMLRDRWAPSFQSSEDWWLFYRLSKETPFAAVREPAFYYRRHSSSLTSKSWRLILKDAQTVASMIQQDFEGVERYILKRKVNSRLLANAAIAAREQDGSGYFPLISSSLVWWPFPDIGLARYKLFAKMFLQSLFGIPRLTEYTQA